MISYGFERSYARYLSKAVALVMLLLLQAIEAEEQSVLIGATLKVEGVNAE